MFAKIATRDDLELVKGCLGDDVPGVREAAAQALAKIATREALELITRLLNDRIVHIREIAQHYLVTAAMNIKKKGRDRNLTSSKISLLSRFLRNVTPLELISRHWQISTTLFILLIRVCWVMKRMRKQNHDVLFLPFNGYGTTHGK